MKLVMKADDGKEIVYLTNDKYDVLTIKDLENTVLIDISKLEKEYKKYLDPFIKEDNTEIFSWGKNEEDEFVLSTPNIYYIFSIKLNDILKNNAALFLNYDLGIGYWEKYDNDKYWNIFFIGTI